MEIDSTLGQVPWLFPGNAIGCLPSGIIRGPDILGSRADPRKLTYIPPALIDHGAWSFGERWMSYSIPDNLSYRPLSVIRQTARLPVNSPGDAIPLIRSMDDRRHDG